MVGAMKEQKGAGRALLWLFKGDQSDGWYAAASLVGSVAQTGEEQTEALGGWKLVKPLMWVLRNGEREGKYAAARGLLSITNHTACRDAMSQVRCGVLFF